jgi:hypothetical protein
MARKRRKADVPTGKRLEPAAAVVVYDGKTGAIFGSHLFSVAEGAELPERGELDRIALAHAARDGCDVRRHKVLHVDPTTLKPGCHYAVSMKATKATLVEQPQRRKRAAASLYRPA